MTTTSAPPHGPHRRRALGAVAAVAGAVGLMGAGGCGIQSSGMRVVGSAPTLQAANDVTGGQTSGSGNQYTLYFFRNGRLSAVQRYSDQKVTDELVLAALIKGPTSTDQSEGYNSVIPSELTVVSTTARDQQWNYQYSMPLTTMEKAEIVCTVQALGAPSVGTVLDGNEIWNDCNDFSEDYGAPAILPSVDSDSASPSADSFN